MTWEIRQGDALELLRAMPDESVDAIVTDPPYHLTTLSRRGSARQNDPETPFGRTRLGSAGFMGKTWDGGDVAFRPETWVEALRAAKPGAHLLAFGGTRTYHRLTCAVEDAGWEIRDCLAWLYGSGFPKSKNGPWGGTALKPAFEPIVLARKPLTGTVAANVQEHGTGALNIDGCRIESEKPTGWGGGGTKLYEGGLSRDGGAARPADGRWPANVVLDPEAAAMLDEQSGSLSSGANPKRRGAPKFRHAYGEFVGQKECAAARGADSGGASRFFYTAKASSSERHYAGKNAHPTVKPVELMRWLVRLVTPPGGLVLDPFCGSGSTGIAALSEGFRFVGMELDAESVATARKRIAGPLFVGQGA